MSDHNPSRRSFMQDCSLGTASLLALQSSTLLQANEASSRPNILFIMTDQQRFDGLGANGNELIQTPNLDRLAAESANLQSAYVQSPVCVPSRGCFFTGRYAHSHQNRVNYTPLKKSEVPLQQYLQELGYQTSCVGKLHLYPPTVEHAKQTGFDLLQLHDGAGSTNPYSDYYKWWKANDPYAKRGNYRDYISQPEPGKNPFRTVIAEEFSETHWTGQEARAHLRQLSQSEKPFFHYVSFWKPHSPYDVPAPWAEMYNAVEFPLPSELSLDDIKQLPLPLQKQILRFTPQYDMDHDKLQWIYRSYYAAISQIDHEVGLLLDELEQLGQAENTIVIFTSDHGDQLLAHGLVGKNVFFEESVRIPFLMRYPDRIQPGVRKELIETVDLLPTLFDLIGESTPKRCQGQSFLPLLKGDVNYIPKEAVYCENVIPEVITN
ncbi:MAG: sulfatase-like hydrolase/transferase, partial [Planctomycetaceae bacterium]|nr:sulfatase-like hydrolase/transferase [Planctomycetaceae bacterium]